MSEVRGTNPGLRALTESRDLPASEIVEPSRRVRLPFEHVFGLLSGLPTVVQSQIIHTSAFSTDHSACGEMSAVAASVICNTYARG